MTQLHFSDARSVNHKPIRVVDGRGASLSALKDWIARERNQIETEWVRHGALRLRGFDLLGAEDFEQVAMALEPDL